MSGTPVFVALTSFGSDFSKQKGQAHFLRDIASAGLAGAEIRRELFTSLPASFDDIRECAATHGLRLIYSTPMSLFTADGKLATDNLRQVGREAATLGAEAVKFFLGPVPAGFSRNELLDAIAEFSPVRLFVENDQTTTGGTMARFETFFDVADGLPLDMTFDTGNWSFVGDDMLAAAKTFGHRVAYVHCKSMIDDPHGRRVAAPLDASDDRARQAFACFAPDVARAIEFPLVTADLVGEMRGHARALARLGSRPEEEEK